jgi:hypothetical protein
MKSPEAEEAACERLSRQGKPNKTISPSTTAVLTTTSINFKFDGGAGGGVD